MSKVKVQLEIDRSLALLIPTFKEKVDNGADIITVQANRIRGETMALVLAWTSFQGHGQNIEVPVNTNGCGHANGTGGDNEHKSELFLKLVQHCNMTVIIELAEAAIVLQLPLLQDLCAKALANLIRPMSPAEVRQSLKLDDEQAPKPSIDCVHSVLKSLPIEKVLKLGEIKQTEWQVASYRIWKEQLVLFLGTADTQMLNCDNCGLANVTSNGLNLIRCTANEMDQNLESIKSRRSHHIPERIINLLDQCKNLKAITWDSHFGEIVGDKLARVLERKCPNLVHIEGPVVEVFNFKQGNLCREVCPAPFYNPHDTVACYKVTTRSHSAELEPDQHSPRKKLKTGNGTTARHSVDCHNYSARVANEDKSFKAFLKAIIETKNLVPTRRKDYSCIIKSWFDELVHYVTTDSQGQVPGVVDNRPIERSDLSGELRKGLRENVDYVSIPDEKWHQLRQIFGLVNYIRERNITVCLDSMVNNVCTYRHEHNGKPIYQHWYNCETCGLFGDDGICSVCVENCHKGHEVTYNQYSDYVCDCRDAEGRCKVIPADTTGSLD